MTTRDHDAASSSSSPNMATATTARAVGDRPRAPTRIEFTGSLGHRLAARLDEPTTAGGDPAAAYALLAHCFTCGKDILAAARIARGLAARGFGVLRFDFTGLGHSEGEFANTTFTSNVGDLIAASAWLREHRQAPAVLIGHSLGGAAVLAAAEGIPEARAVVTIGAPAEPVFVRTLLGTRAARAIEDEGTAEVAVGGRPFRIGRGLLADLAAQDPQDRIARLNRALLIFHSPVDRVVGIDHATRIFEWARHPKSFVSLDGADHLLSRPGDSEFVAGVIAAWAAWYAGKPAASGPD